MSYPERQILPDSSRLRIIHTSMCLCARAVDYMDTHMKIGKRAPPNVRACVDQAKNETELARNPFIASINIQ